MKMHEDGTSKSSGYVEIPIQVLYKTEYIDSVVQQRRKAKSLNNMLKKAKIRITSTFGKLRDRITSVLRGYYQEITINNVDGKTRQNMIGYIKSLNLETKEFIDADGTRVIIVDIGPIKKKPEMNDLLVYIENEKLKIARRTEAKTKTEDKNEHYECSNKWSPQNRGETFVEENAMLSDKLPHLHSRGGGDGVRIIDKASKTIDMEKNRSKTKSRKTQSEKISPRKKVTLGPISDKEETKKSFNPNKILDSKNFNKVLTSKESCLEDPLTKAEKRVKLRMKSKSKATNKTDSIKEDQDRFSKIALTFPSSSGGVPVRKELINSSTNDSSGVGWSLNSFINPQMNGIGVFWNAESVMYNDTKINLIERTNAIKDKEMSVNVIAQYYNKEVKGSAKESKTINELNCHHEKATEINNVSRNETKASKETQIMSSETLERDSITKTDKKHNNDSSKPFIQMKDVEPYTSNGLTGDPSFQKQPMVARVEVPTELNIETDNEGKCEPSEATKNKKKKKKFVRFCKRLFKTKNRTKKEAIQNKLNPIENTVPFEVSMKYLAENDNKGEEKQMQESTTTVTTTTSKQTEKQLSKDLKKKQGEKMKDYMNTEFKIKNPGSVTVFNCTTDNESTLQNRTSSKDNRQQWFDRGDNLKTLPMSETEVCEIQIPQSSKNVLFNWKQRQLERTEDRHTRHKNVVNKLYRKLKSFKNLREASDSEMTSSTDNWVRPKKHKTNETYCFDDFTLSSLDSVQLSVDTVQSVTQTVIKRLAKSYPKEKRT